MIRLLRYWRVSQILCVCQRNRQEYSLFMHSYIQNSVFLIFGNVVTSNELHHPKKTFRNFLTLPPRGILEKPLNLFRQELLISTTHILFCFFFQSFFGGKNRNEMLIMSLKNKEIGTSCKKHLKTTIFSAVMP